MELVIILGLILLGSVLFFLEIFFLPGFIFAIIGSLLMIAGIYYSYSSYGSFIGNITLLSTIALNIISLVMGFKSGLWNKASLKDTNDGKMNTIDHHTLNVGDEGIAESKIAIIGKASFNGQNVEVESTHGYVSEGTKIVITKIDHNKIFIKPQS